jgi:hypothetical protein
MSVVGCGEMGRGRGAGLGLRVWLSWGKEGEAHVASSWSWMSLGLRKSAKSAG